MSTQHILIIGRVWPEPVSTAAGTRMLQLIEQFRQAGWRITFASAAAKTEYSAGLPGMDAFSIELNSSSFDVWVKELQPSVVLFDRFMMEEQFGWRVAEQCPDALRIIDTEDLHCLREARKIAYEKQEVFTSPLHMHTELAKREIAAILRSDLSLIISTEELNLLQNVFKVDRRILHYIPFLYERMDERITGSWLPMNQRHHFISIGNFLHEPNWNAVLELKKNIWPLIRKKLPEAGLHIYGAYATKKVEDLNNPKEGFLVKGRAASVKEVMGTARVCLAPLNYGAGLKGKLLDAMLCGTPSVTTPVGAEAMHGDLPWNGSIVTGSMEFAAAAVELYTRQDLWNNAQSNGIRIVNACYAKEEHGKELIGKILAVKERLAEHRNDNFIGSVLMHHTLNSTRYMSKWIEEKNTRK